MPRVILEPQAGPRPFSKIDTKTDAIARKGLRAAIAKLKQTRCGSVLPLGEILAAGLSMHFYDARPDALYAGVTQDYVSGNGVKDITLYQTGYGNTAAVLGGKDNTILPVAILRADWWSDKSGNTLVHEVMHYALQADDRALANSLSAAGFRPTSEYGTSQMTDWLDAGCPDQAVIRRRASRSGRYLW